jgi:DNA-binding transcriptional LysR family regulator
MAILGARLTTPARRTSLRRSAKITLRSGRERAPCPPGRAARPDVEIALLEDSSDQIITALQDGLIDLGLVGDTDPDPAGIETQIVADEPLVAAVSPEHPLATQTTVALGKLKDQPLISLPRGTGLRLRLEQACATAGFTPRIAFQASDPRTLAALAAQGLGIAIITHAAADTYAPDVEAVKITRPELRARLKLAWRSPQGPTNPAAHALTDHARGQLSSQAIS